MISYAQNLEDVMLARVFRGQAQGFYIDVGAMHPLSGSVTKHSYELGWRGINVEPSARYHALLAEQRTRDMNLGLALGERPGRGVLHRVGSTGLSSLDPSVLEVAARRGETVEDEVVEVATLASICEQHVRGEIDFLKVDVEGSEGAVLRGGDWKRFRPRVVVVEATRPNSMVPSFAEWEDVLLEADYAFAYFDGLNRFYVRRESAAELLSGFAAPPNVFDEWIPYRAVVAEEKVEKLRRRLAKLERRSVRKQLGRIVRRLFGEAQPSEGRSGARQR